MALSVEAGELMEHFRWLTPEEAASLGDDPDALAEVASEMADVAIFLLRMADVMGVDLASAVRRKVAENDRRFPVERIRGRATLPPDDDSAESGP
jgi:dCTP diphosphatase